MDLSGELVSQLFQLPETIEKMMSTRRENENKGGGGGGGGGGNIPVDILETPKEYVFYMDVPGIPKSDIQVTVEDENNLVIKSNGKRKREESEEEGCKYIRLERRPPQKLMRKFRLPEDANAGGISAKCENGVLTVVVEKKPPPPKPKTVEVAIS